MIVDITGMILIPGNDGKDCPGNGCIPGVECCCNECDYMLCCIPELIGIKARNAHTPGTDNERINRFIAWKRSKVINDLEDEYTREEIQEKNKESLDFRDRQNSRVAEIPL